MEFIWLLLAIIALGVGGWQLAVWIGEIRSKNRKYQEAQALVRNNGKLLLVAGGPWGARRPRHWLKLPAHGSGDVCLDIDCNAIAGCPNGVKASVTHIPFSDKSFSAAFASHLLEHLPKLDDALQALAELNRVADEIYIAYPSQQSISGWLTPGHHLWVWQEGNKIYIKQRGQADRGKKEDIYVIQPATKR